MAKTRQGEFEKTYHHIDAPTNQDDEYGKGFKRRILINPLDRYCVGSEDFDKMDASYRSPELAYLQDNHWIYKRKLDGENIRIYWDGEQALWNGKTNRFQCSADFQNYMNNTFIEEIFEEKFGRDKEAYIYGEKMGPKTQGNELGLNNDELIIFDVEINDTFLGEENIKQVAEYFSVKSVYDYMPEEDLRDDLLNADGEPLEMGLLHLIDAVANNQFPKWEGIVCTPACNIKDQNGNRIIVKIKNKDYNKDWRKK